MYQNGDLHWPKQIILYITVVNEYFKSTEIHTSGDNNITHYTNT
jgi:hypothetical protein